VFWDVAREIARSKDRLLKRESEVRRLIRSSAEGVAEDGDWSSVDLTVDHRVSTPEEE